MPLKDKVLIVEDDTGICNVLTAVLSTSGYETITAATAREADTLIRSHCPDLVLLDLGLPDRDGLEVIRAVRGWSGMPIVVVSARSQEADKVAALDAGADDYIVKPFGSEELLARIRTALRHARSAGASSDIARTGILRVGGLAIDYDRRQVTVDGAPVHLTPNEFKILALLGRNTGRVLTYDAIIRELWGPGTQGDNQILRVNMANIRRKIEQNPAEPRYVFTEAGVGYRMAEEKEQPSERPEQ